MTRSRRDRPAKQGFHLPAHDAEGAVPDAKEEDVRAFIGLARTSEDSGSRRNADAVFQVSASANRRLYDRLRRSTDICDALMEIFQDEDILARLMKKYGLSHEDAETYLLAQV